MNIDEQSDPTPSYHLPSRQFRGEPLAPYSLGNRALISSLGRQEDSPFLIYFVILYVLVRPRIEAQALTWNGDSGRKTILDWMDSLNLSAQEEKEAVEMIKAIVAESSKEKVDPVATGSPGNA